MTRARELGELVDVVFEDLVPREPWDVLGRDGVVRDVARGEVGRGVEREPAGTVEVHRAPKRSLGRIEEIAELEAAMTDARELLTGARISLRGHDHIVGSYQAGQHPQVPGMGSTPVRD